MAGALLVYALCGLSGLLVERRLALDSLVKRVMVLSVAGAAQLMLAVQLLSLFRGLSGAGLVLANAAFTLLTFVLVPWRATPNRARWPDLLRRRLDEARAELRDPWSLALAIAGAGLFATACVAGWVMCPFNDPYHSEMPLFWIQNQSILPFPVHNPRIVALSFLTEALQLPGFLYARLDRTPAVATVLSGALVLWTIFSLARRAGAGWAASLCAASIATGYTRVALDCFHGSAEMLLTGAWFGGSLLFLMDLRAHRAAGSFRAEEIGVSVFLFLMACGAKNSTVLLTPLYLPLLAWALFGKGLVPGRAALRAAAVSTGAAGDAASGGEPPAGHVRRLVLWFGVWGLAGLLCSGVAWNYLSNRLWFPQGLPEILSTTLSQDFHPRSIWTRICRGAVLVAGDTIWVPGRAREAYVSLCQNTVVLLGGKPEIAEDEGHFSFEEEHIKPLKGLGLLGIACFVPGVALACAGLLRPGGFRPAGGPVVRFNVLLLVLMTIGSFVVCHAVLRWQSIGVLRLMFPFVVAGAPLAAFLLELRWLRAGALGLLLVTGALLSAYWAGHISRRMGWDERPSMSFIARLRNTHDLALQCQWKGQPARELRIRESYTYHEIYQALLQGLRQPAVIGFVGHANSECGRLFGAGFQNRVVPLVDARAEGRLLPPTAALDYVIAVAWFAPAREWAAANGFEETCRVGAGEEDKALVFGKRTVSPAASEHRQPAHPRAMASRL